MVKESQFFQMYINELFVSINKLNVSDKFVETVAE
jgi:hypothetical protein